MKDTKTFRFNMIFQLEAENEQQALDILANENVIRSIVQALKSGNVVMEEDEISLDIDTTLLN